MSSKKPSIKLERKVATTPPINTYFRPKDPEPPRENHAEVEVVDKPSPQSVVIDLSREPEKKKKKAYVKTDDHDEELNSEEELEYDKAEYQEPDSLQLLLINHSLARYLPEYEYLDDVNIKLQEYVIEAFMRCEFLKQ